MPAFNYPPTATEILPDHAGDRYRFRFKVRSSSGNGEYVIAYDTAPKARWWTCSCPGGTFRGQCRHLDVAGLSGRKYGRSPMPEMAPARVEPPAVVILRKRKVASRQAAPVSAPGFALSRRAIAEDKATKAAMWRTFVEGADEEVLEMLAAL
jgi:hypothetical protein